MINDLVSIIIPCYNGEEFLEKTFDSYLNQNYKKLEIFFVDDGSTDNTQKICKEYEKKFKKNNINFIYNYQKNKGQAAAINKVLNLINGQFLMWPDSDDIIPRDSIQKKVNFLKNNKDYALVRTAVEIRSFDNDTRIDEFKLKNPSENIFEDLIFSTSNIFWAPVSYMVNVEKFRNTNPEMKIYESRGGQNIQMLLPITYKYKCGYIDELLAIYYVRKNSHCRSKKISLDREIYEYDIHKDILENTLKKIGLFEEYEKRINYMFAKFKIDAAYKYDNLEIEKKYYYFLKDNNQLTFKDKLKYFIKSKKNLNRLYKLCKLKK